MVYTAIKKLVQYGLETGLITETDRIYESDSGGIKTGRV